MKVEDAANKDGRFVVVRIVWNGIPPEACYGPFAVADDGSHLDVIHEFVRKWTAKHGEPSSVTLYAVFAPGEVDDLLGPSEV